MNNNQNSNTKSQFVLSQVGKNKKVFKDRTNTFKILVATDNHVGYKENDPIRFEDSLKAFEEVLDVAKEEKVDFLLLGGDLFHETCPSQKCLHKMMNLLYQKVLGDGEISFSMPNYEANFQDENINIELPIFIIHGNHDYPSDECGSLSVLDLLHTNKYLNHFGKYSNIQKIKVNPIIFQKKDTTIALYGVGYMKDRYFHRMLEEDNIEFVPPSALGFENTVNILVIHQSRYKGVRAGGSYRNCVHPEQFPDWLDLIIRGHEHEQIDELETLKSSTTIKVIQPGSTIPTSLIPSEATPRRAMLLEVNQQDANLQDIILIKSYRPVLYENIEIEQLFKQAGVNTKKSKIYSEEVNEKYTDEEGEKLLWQQVQKSIKEFNQTLSEEFPQCKWLMQKKPQIRFKVEHSGVDIFNFSRIENRLSEIVANPGEVFKFWKRAANQVQRAIIENPKLENDFYKVLREKQDFDTLGNDAAKDVKELFEARIQQNKRIGFLPQSIVMNSINSLGDRSKQQLDDILKNLQSKLDDNISKTQEAQVKKINSDYKQQMSSILNKINNNIMGKKSSIDRNNINQYDNNAPRQNIFYKTAMNSQIDELKTIGIKIKQKVNEMYSLDFLQDQLLIDQDALNQQEMLEKQTQQQLLNASKYKNNQRQDALEEEDEEEEYQQQEDQSVSIKEKRKRRRKSKSPIPMEQEEVEMKQQLPLKKNSMWNEQDEEAEQQNNPKKPNKKHVYSFDNSEDEESDKFQKSAVSKGMQNNSNKRVSLDNKRAQIELNNREESAQKYNFQRLTYAQMFKKNINSDEDEINMEEDDESTQSDCEFKIQDKESKSHVPYQIPHISQLKKDQQLNAQKQQQNPIQNQKSQFLEPNIKQERQNEKQQSKKSPTQSSKNSNKQSQLMFDKNLKNIKIEQETLQQSQQEQQQVAKSKILIPLNKKKIDENDEKRKAELQQESKQVIHNFFRQNIRINNSKQ